LDPSHFSLWNQLLIIDAALNDIDNLLVESQEAMELFPAQPSFYLFNGIANSRKKKHDDAIEALEGGLPLVIENDALLAQFYALLGDNYHELEKHEKSDKAYDKSLAIIPNQPGVLNNYAFYLSLRKEKLQLAEEMAAKANSLTPNIATYQDTYGWVLYKLAKYEEAKTWLQKALDGGGDKSGEVLEHFGDVQFQLGDKANALKYWKMAKTAGGTTTNIDRKINDEQLYE